MLMLTWLVVTMPLLIRFLSPGKRAKNVGPEKVHQNRQSMARLHKAEDHAKEATRQPQQWEGDRSSRERSRSPHGPQQVSKYSGPFFSYTPRSAWQIKKRRAKETEDNDDSI